MQQYVGCAWRVNAQRSTNNSATGIGRLDDVRFEVFVEIFGDAHRPEADGFVHRVFAHLHELHADLIQALYILGFERCRIWRRAQ